MQLIVVEWRLPRVLMALLIGAALGVSGAIFSRCCATARQPDILGFNTGAYSGVLVALVLFNQSITAMTGAALIGGIATAALVYLFWRNGWKRFG